MALVEKPAHPALVRRGEGVSAEGQFWMPTRVFFGRSVSETASEHAVQLSPNRRVMLVTDPGVRDAGLVDPIQRSLTDAGISVTVFDTVEPNPRDVDCLSGAAVAADANVDALVALGGGSPIDTAKCIGLLRTNGGHPRDWEDFGALRQSPLPVIAIPTTAGTGSEVSPSAVITDTDRRKKMNLFDMRNCPSVSLVDPDLTFSCPPGLTAASGLDALSHAIDSLTCRLATPQSDALALEGARLIALYLVRAFRNPSDVEARCGMAQASLTAGLAVGLTDVAGAHCLGEAIGGLYGHPHGYCCAVCLPPIMEYNNPACREKHSRLALAFGIDGDPRDHEEMSRAAIEYVRGLNRDLEVPLMSSLIHEEDLDLLGDKAEQNTSTPSNARTAGARDFREMFAKEL